VTVYRTAKLPPRSILRALQWCLGIQTPTATVIHVRGTTLDATAFAGAVVLTDDRGLPAHDLVCYGAPIDDAELALAIDEALGFCPAVHGEMKRACE
jgi:hypothetical protein